LARCSALGNAVEHLEESGEAYSRRVGALEPDALPGHEPRDGPEHREPVITAGTHTPTLRAGWDPSHPETIIARGDPDAKGPEPVSHSFDPVRFFYAQLSRAGHDALSSSRVRREREQRQLVDHARN